MRPSGAALVAAALGCVAPLSAARAAAPAEDPVPEAKADDARINRVVPGDERDLFWLEHRFALRFRPELLVGGDLGNDASPVPVPLEATAAGGNEDASTLAWASLRLRYEPTLRIGSDLAIRVGLDAFDNLVLGSTPVESDFTRGLYDDSAAPQRAGINSVRDALRVRYAFAHYEAFNFLDVSLGRMVDHFGLGLFRNAGDCTDCDFGSYVDGLRFGLTAFGARLDFSWEMTASGALYWTPGVPGQVVDLGQEDDVSTYVIRLGGVPPSARERERRAAATGEIHVDWGVLAAFTDQTLSSSEQPEPDAGCTPTATFADGTLALPYDCIALVPRDASFFRPEVWGRLVTRFDELTALRVELELGAVFGSIENLQRLEDTTTAKDVTAWGGALELELQRDMLRIGLYSGFATGDNGDHLGYLDGQSIVEPDDNLYAENDNVRLGGDITSYWFNRDYRLDLILFRQIIGGVTNAVYVKPWVSSQLLDTGSFALAGRLEVLYAAAMRPSGTPGDGFSWGVEVDGHLDLTLEVGVTASLGLGLLIPLDALDDPQTGAAADLSFGMRGQISWSF